MRSDGKAYPIVTFDQIIDTDFGLLQMINNKYNDRNTFHWSLLEAYGKVKLGLLYNRKHPNPLTVIAKEYDNIELLDDYYNQFIEQEYPAILKESISTRLYIAFKGFIESSIKSIIPTIVCKNKMEENYLNKIDKDLSSKCNIVVEEKGYRQLLKDDRYTTIYIKNIMSIDPFIEYLKGRTVFIADYRFNFQDDERIKLADPYHDIITSIAAVRVYNMYDKEKDILEGV